MRGIESQAMVLCASNADHTQVELIKPPVTSPPLSEAKWFMAYLVEAFVQQPTGGSQDWREDLLR